jgi:2-aminoethylphosphonate-pyruvate transaminase
MIKTAVILAAGMGSRLKEKTKDKPKGFLEVAGKALITMSVEKLLHCGIEEIICGTGYLSEHYENFALNHKNFHCVRNDIYASTGSMYTLYNMRNVIHSDFLLLESDLIYERRGLKMLIDDVNADCILASGETSSGDEVFIEADKSNHLVNMSKDKNKINNVFGELVGITKLSLQAYDLMCDFFAGSMASNIKMDYEYALVGISKQIMIPVKKIPDLIWSEIDDANHLQRTTELVYPKIREMEKHDSN